MADNELFGISEQLDDTISRAAVLALPRSITRNMRGEVVEETIDVAAIKALPSAQPERKKGKWMLGVSLWYCSECGSSYSYNDYAFCPNCGADMKGERNDT